MAYKKKTAINWCIDCKIGLANEEVVNGLCERCGGATEKREKEQWMLAITKYADRLYDDLDKVDYLEKIKIQQRNWIGRNEGAEIVFPISQKTWKQPRALIIHGFDGDPSEGWKPWLTSSLEMAGFEVRSPKLPNTKHPNFEETMAFLKKETADFTKDDTVIGHSLGAHFALKLAEKKSLQK